jgi:hypothetical protein
MPMCLITPLDSSTQMAVNQAMEIKGEFKLELKQVDSGMYIRSSRVVKVQTQSTPTVDSMVEVLVQVSIPL